MSGSLASRLHAESRTIIRLCRDSVAESFQFGDICMSGPDTGACYVDDEYDSHVVSCDRAVSDAALTPLVSGSGAASLRLLA